MSHPAGVASSAGGDSRTYRSVCTGCETCCASYRTRTFCHDNISLQSSSRTSPSLLKLQGSLSVPYPIPAPALSPSSSSSPSSYLPLFIPAAISPHLLFHKLSSPAIPPNSKIICPQKQNVPFRHFICRLGGGGKKVRCRLSEGNLALGDSRPSFSSLSILLFLRFTDGRTLG